MAGDGAAGSGRLGVIAAHADRGGAAVVLAALAVTAAKVVGGLNLLAGALVLTGVIHPPGSVDGRRRAGTSGLWDLAFLVWVIPAGAGHGRLPAPDGRGG